MSECTFYYMQRRCKKCDIMLKYSLKLLILKYNDELSILG